MKHSIYILVLFCLAIFISCKKDFLQRDPKVAIDFEKLFSDPKLAAGFGDNTYTFLINDYARMQAAHQGTTGEFADEAISNTGVPAVTVMNTGQFLSPNAFDVVTPYTILYRGIRNANFMLANMDRVPWENSPEYNAAHIKGEQLYLRAFFYFELMKRYGGVVLLDKAQTVEESALDLPRSSYDSTLAYIINDLDKAATLLPLEWPIAARDYGRATLGAALAVKARALLHAASPLNNAANNALKWKTAATAAKVVMDLNFYKLMPSYDNVLILPSDLEYIMISVKAPRGWVGYINDFIAPPSFAGQQSLISPTQNHIDLYEMKNGLPINDPASGYNPQNPYFNRDPRFYTNIIYNNQIWQGRAVQTYVGGLDVSTTSNIYTKTGYYVKRLWPEVIRSTSGTQTLNYVYLRYAEVLLNYAEALNESDGPVSEVYTAVNAVRLRAGLPVLPGGLTKDLMRNRIRNERAVEFAFEDMRWWDILRWKKGIELVAQPMRGMGITRIGTVFTYTPVALPNYQKTFLDYMHLYPIPLNEVVKSAGKLIQNPGWN